MSHCSTSNTDHHLQELVKVREESVRRSFNRPDAFLEEDMSDHDYDTPGFLCIFQGPSNIKAKMS